jgi:DNA-binding transcriptional LysR family regulator
MVSLKSLAYVVTLARHRHFGEASSHLGVTQSALSQGIAALERELGVRLFDRDHNGARITAAGQLVIDRAEQLLAGESELRREIDLLRGLDTGSLSIAAGPHASEMFVAEAVARLAASHPSLQVMVASGYFHQIHEQVLRGSVEVGVSDIAGWRAESRLEFTSLGRPRLVIACRPGHPLAGRREVSLAEVWSYPLTSPMLTGSVAAQLPARSAAGRRDETTGHFIPAFCTDSATASRLIATSSDAVYGGPEALVRREIATGALVTVDVSLGQLDIEYGAYTRRGRTLSPSAREFLSLLAEVAAEVR